MPPQSTKRQKIQRQHETAGARWSAALAFKFAILTAARTAEALSPRADRLRVNAIAARQTPTDACRRLVDVASTMPACVHRLAAGAFQCPAAAPGPSSGLAAVVNRARDAMHADRRNERIRFLGWSSNTCRAHLVDDVNWRRRINYALSIIVGALCLVALWSRREPHQPKARPAVQKRPQPARQYPRRGRAR
jgi:hypothetical protein